MPAGNARHITQPRVGYWLISLSVAGLLQGCDRLSQSFNPPKPSPTKSRALAVIVNGSDPLSVQIGNYYQQQRHIPQENIITLYFDPKRTTIPPEEFQTLKAQIDAKTSTAIQGYALTWAEPYRVGCMSITSAVTFGFDPKHCAQGCHPTAINPLFNQLTQRPFDDLQMRPTMAIAARSFQSAKALIDRGVAADQSRPTGTAYLVSTPDRARNVRSMIYPFIQEKLHSRFPIQIIETNTLQQRSDVMFYFTGLSQVEDIATNQFHPGAMADHLTSFGGMLTDSGQMSSLKWLEAGATGSYGTVQEPCNFVQKFPNPGVAIAAYLEGDTLLQAYWKSVLQPGQGIFIGEPLAQPFGSAVE